MLGGRAERDGFRPRKSGKIREYFREAPRNCILETMKNTEPDSVDVARAVLAATAGIAFPLSLGFASYGLRRPMSQYCMSMPRNYIRRGWNVPFC